MKKLLILAIWTFLSAAVGVNAQNRSSVSAAEVNGTFRAYFSGKFKDSYSEIKILALGKGKLRVAFELTYPYIDGTGELSANTGATDSTAAIEGDTAIFSSDEYGQCKITVKFVKRGTIEVTQEGTGDCGFGHNVSAAGIYKKSSGAKPKFDAVEN